MPDLNGRMLPIIAKLMSAFQNGAALEEDQEGPGSPLLCWIIRIVHMCSRSPTFPRSDVADQFKAKSLHHAFRAMPKGVSCAVVQQPADGSPHGPWPTALANTAGADVEASSAQWRFCWDTIVCFLLQHGPASIVSALVEISCRNAANENSNAIWVLASLQRFPRAVSAWALQANGSDLARLTDLLLSSTFQADSDTLNAAEDALGVVLGLLQEALCLPQFGDELKEFVCSRGLDLCARLYEQCTELMRHNSAVQLQAKLLRLLLWTLSRRPAESGPDRAQIARATELLVSQLPLLMKTGASREEVMKLAYLLSEACGRIVDESCKGDRDEMSPEAKVEKFVHLLLEAESLMESGVSSRQVEAGLQSLHSALQDSALGKVQHAIIESCDLILKLLSVSEHVGVRQQGVVILTKVFDLSLPEAAILQESFGSLVTTGSAGVRAAQSTVSADFFGMETRDCAATTRRSVSKQTRKSHFDAILESAVLKNESQSASQVSWYQALGIEPPDGPEQVAQGEFSLVITDTVKENLRKVLDSYKNTTPLLLEGGTGVGKVCLLAPGSSVHCLVSCPRHLISFPCASV